MRPKKLLPVLLFATLTCLTLFSNAQEFRISTVELTGESIILHYDLIDTVKSRTYSINVYSSKDNFLSPLTKVKGDAGLEVRPGLNKKIVWASKEELGSDFHADLELEIRGRVYIPFVRFNDFDANRVIRRGVPTPLTWSGGSRQNILNFAIFRGDDFITVIPNVANTGSYDIVLPTDIKPGKGYRFVVSDNKNKDQSMQTSTFEVKRKIPLLVKIVPLALVVGAVPLLVSKGGGTAVLDNPPSVPGASN